MVTVVCCGAATLDIIYRVERLPTGAGKLLPTAMIEVAHGMTIAQLFADRIRNGKAGDYLIRVNRQPVASDSVLQEGDRVSVTPTKIEGA